MLRGLEIRDMLIIDRLELSFQPGLNVLTGETGAGKSILLDCLGFVLGWRGRAELVRSGAEQGEVSAVFDLTADHPAHAILNEAGLPVEDELILRRINTAQGRKTAWVNDRRCSGEVLRALSEKLVELHGQHDDRGLLNPRGHRQLLDDFADLEADRRDVRDKWRALGQVRRDQQAALDALNAVKAEEEFLRHAVGEFDDLAPQPGEDGELDARRRLMQGAGRIREDIVKAHGLLGYEGAEGAMGDAMRWLEGVVDRAEGALDAPIAALSRALVELGEAEDGVARCLETLDFDPNELERTEERLFAIRALARKHDVQSDDLADFGESLREKLAALERGDADMRAISKAVTQAELEYDTAAQALSAARHAAAHRLDVAVSAELEPLKMERAVFTTHLAAGDPGPDGFDAVDFRVATNPGAPSGPLARIASGGELSRFLLALKVCLSNSENGVTMIFDEIDRGVGGATADAVGRRLAALAKGGQILTVTHSPQVAALGAHHWRVEKRVDKDKTFSTVVALSEEARIDEIARMISGDRITPEARAAAEQLIAPKDLVGGAGG